MRFKATLAPEQLSLLYSLVVPISKLTSSGANGGANGNQNGCMLFLDQECMRLSLHGKGTNDCAGIACFVELKTSGGIFKEHRIESIAENNAILMECDIVQLRMALQSIQQEKYQSKKRNHQSMMSNLTDTSYSQSLEERTTILKLAKRNNTPCLCVEAGGRSGVEIQHAIPVRIARASDMKHYLPPCVPTPSVQLEMSSSERTPLRTIMDRLRLTTPTVLVTGNPSGQLILELPSDNGDGISIRTVIDGLIPRMEACDPEKSGPCTVKVDSKKLALCLQWQQQTALVSTAFLCLVENEALVLHAMLNPSDAGFFTYYIPVHFLWDDDEDD